MKISFTTAPRFRRPLGLGTGLQTVIEAGLVIAPLPAATKRRLHNCAGCNRSAARLNKAVPNINPLASSKMQPPAASDDQ